MQEEYDVLNTCREELKGRYKSVEKEVAEARKQLENVMKYMGMEQEERKATKHSRILEKEIKKIDIKILIFIKLKNYDIIF